MQHTTNYGLKKPELNDNVNINDFNENADIIDQKLKENENALAAHQAEDATDAHNISNITGLQNALDSKQDELPEERIRKITFGTDEPTGGEHGDIYFQYEE